MVILAFIVGTAAGILSGFGIGGGTILILWLTLAAGLDQRQAGGLNLLYYSFPALPALIGHFQHGLVEKKLVIFCILSGLPCCVLAAYLADSLDVTLLKRGFGIVLLYVGLREIFSPAKPKKKQPPSPTGPQ